MSGRWGDFAPGRGELAAACRRVGIRSLLHGSALARCQVSSVFPRLPLAIFRGRRARWHGPARKYLGTFSPQDVPYAVLARGARKALVDPDHLTGRTGPPVAQVVQAYQKAPRRGGSNRASRRREPSEGVA